MISYKTVNWSLCRVGLHETEYQELRLSRPPLGSQLRVFLHALKALSARAKLDLKFHREKSLKHAGIFEPVPSMQVAPKELREIRPQVHTLCDGGFSKAMKGLFPLVLRRRNALYLLYILLLCGTSTYDLSAPNARIRN